MTTCTFIYASSGCHPKDIKCVQISFKTDHNSPLRWCKALLGWQEDFPLVQGAHPWTCTQQWKNNGQTEDRMQNG